MVAMGEVHREMRVLVATKNEADLQLEGHRRVLIVDDDDSVGQLLAMMLQAAEFDVVGVAETGTEAILIAIEEQPDAAVLACGIPGWSAELLARWIRDASPSVRIIAVSEEEDSDPTWAEAHFHRLHIESVKDALERLL